MESCLAKLHAPCFKRPRIKCICRWEAPCASCHALHAVWPCPVPEPTCALALDQVPGKPSPLGSCCLLAGGGADTVIHVWELCPSADATTLSVAARINVTDRTNVCHQVHGMVEQGSPSQRQPGLERSSVLVQRKASPTRD